MSARYYPRLAAAAAVLLLACGAPAEGPADVRSASVGPSAVAPATLDGVAVAIVTDDFPASKRFYVDYLGFEERTSFSIDEAFGARSGLSDGVPFEVTVLSHGAGPATMELKLVSFGDGPKAGGDYPVQARAGVQYLTFKFSEVGSILERLAAAGIPTSAETPFALGDGRQFVVVRDPNGVVVELIGATGD